MDGFTGFKTAAAEEIPAAVAVMDPFTWVRLAGDALNDCRRRVQQTTRGRRGRKNDGRLEHLRGSALGFRNLTNYIARSLLETGGFRPRLHPALVKSRSSWGSAKDTTETGNQ